MKVLFLTLAKINHIEDNGIYTDLLRKFRDNGHDVTIVCPVERKYKSRTQFHQFNGVKILKVLTLNFQKTNFIEKGIATLLVEFLFLYEINKKLEIKDIDLILYTTPPITFTFLISFLKKKSNASTYLLLKDIFPQNAVDLKIIKNSGFMYRFFRKKELELYKVSDFIGCMSPRNLNYLISHNPQINPGIVEVNPNSIEINKINKINKISNRDQLLKKYKFPVDKTLFLFGGNLGLPQGIEHIKTNIRYCENVVSAFFIIVGDGTEYSNLHNWFKENDIGNACLIKELPKSEFDDLLSIADVGLIFLNPLFTIPNFPSRLLNYLQNRLPIICAVDSNTDIGIIAEKNKFGFNCLTNDCNTFLEYVVKLLNKDLRILMGENGYKFLCNEYSTEVSYNKILNKFN
jgi:glycosyltransferase involved in cell wall biosynthesis